MNMDYTQIIINQIKQTRNMLKFTNIAVIDMDAGSGDLGKAIREDIGHAGLLLHAVEPGQFFGAHLYDGIYNCRHLNTCENVMDELTYYKQKVDVIIFNFTLENYDKTTALKLLRKAYMSARYIIINTHSEMRTEQQKCAFKIEEIKSMFQGFVIERNIENKTKTFNIFIAGK